MEFFAQLNIDTDELVPVAAFALDGCRGTRDLVPGADPVQSEARNVQFIQGPDGEESGAMYFTGSSDSFVLLTRNARLDIR